MNKKEFLELRKDVMNLKGLIYSGLDSVEIGKYRMARENRTGMILFMSITDFKRRELFGKSIAEKEFPRYYHQIGEHGFMNRDELEEVRYNLNRVRVKERAKQMLAL